MPNSFPAPRVRASLLLLTLACATPIAVPAQVADAMPPAASEPVPAPAASAAAAKARRPEVDAVLQTASIPLRGVTLFGGDLQMVTRVFRPPGPGPFPVVVFSHGRSADRDERAALKLGVGREQLRFWLARGDAVVAPIRPGYGETGGADFEGGGPQFENIGCRSGPHYEDVAEAASHTVVATLDWLKSQPWADSAHVLLAGQSYGGFTTVAAAALKPAGVVGYINYAGGVGGNSKYSPGRSCHPEQVAAVYADLGRTTVVPGLWLYAENDEFWGAEAPVGWHAAFAAGGTRTTFVHAPPVAGGRGHGLSGRAPALWAPAVDAFLATIDFPATPIPPVPSRP